MASPVPTTVLPEEEPLAKRIRRIFVLQDTVTFLLPSAFMSARRRAIILPEIRRKGGEVTEYPSAATHCVMTPFPVGEQRLKQLCTKYGVPDSCKYVPDSFLLRGDATTSVGDADMEERLGQGYIDITHGGGATTVVQPNDTDLHQQLRKRYKTLPTEAFFASGYDIVGGRVPR